MEMVAGASDGAGDGCSTVPVIANLGAEGSHYCTPPIHESPLQQPPQAKEALVDIEKLVSKATEKLNSQLSMKLKRIHRFPKQLRGMGGPNGLYVAPSVVAIGPYHHGQPHLQPMEEVKQAAAQQLCRYLGYSVNEVYQKIVDVAGDARRCYTIDDDTSLVATLRDDEFAAMMFLDGCFLLKCMKNDEHPVTGLNMSCFPAIAKDILLLENQIPLLVLKALLELRPNGPSTGSNKKVQPVMELIDSWVDTVNSVYFLDTKKKKTDADQRRSTSNEEEPTKPQHLLPEPQHLLGILRERMTRGMPSDRRKGKKTNNSLLLSSSAVYLAQIGVKLTASTAEWFADVEVPKKLFFGELSLSPLFLNDIVACILVNLAALEAAEATGASSAKEPDGFVVSSYLSVLAMLMDREEDVRELRGRGVRSSHLSNKQTLDFFKGLSQHLRLGFNYFAVVEDINKYISKRPVRTTLHRFVYNNYKTIIAVLSIVSVLVGIFKALYSLKKP